MISGSDLELWMQLKEGREAAFELIYDRYFNVLYEYGYRLCGDEFIVKDKIQDLFVKIWTRKGKTTIPANVKAYLFGALRNSLNEEFRTTSLHKQILEKVENELADSFSLEFDFLKKEDDRFQLEKLHEALNSLTGRQKEMIYLRYLQDIDYEEIAEVMSITVKASYKLSARALENLKKVLSVNDNELLSLFILLQSSYMLHK